MTRLGASEIKGRVSIEAVLLYYGSMQDAQGRWRCPFHARHHNNDTHHSVTKKAGRAFCWSQKCLGQKGADVFELVGLMEGLSNFAAQKRRVCEIGSITETHNRLGQQRILRRFKWSDTEGNTAWHLRLEPGKPKFMWAQDPDGKHLGMGDCQPMLYELDAVQQASIVITNEGERDCDTINGWLRELGLYGKIVATCTPNGAGDVKSEYLEPLNSKSQVVLTGDNDKAGKDYLKQCRKNLPPSVKDVRCLMPPAGYKDWAEWQEAGATAQEFLGLLNRAEPDLLGEQATEFGPWAKAQTAKDFLSTTEKDMPMLEPPLVARGSVTELFSPRGIGKTHYGHWLAVKLSKAGLRVLLLDRDNSRREVARRLRAWGADGLTTLKVMMRDEVPPLKEVEKWATFPFQDYDLVLIDSLESSMEGAGEQDSAKPSKAIAPLLDIAHRDNGPAILILGNTVRSGDHSRGSGIVEDRADVAFEVRDATDLKPSGTKDWWLELPPAGAKDWGSRASRRKRRKTYRLAFIPSKYRLGEEPDPFVLEISMPDIGEWIVRDVTAGVAKAGEDSKEARETEHQANLDRAALALAEEVWQRAEAGSPMLSGTEAVPFLQTNHNLTREDARQLIKNKIGVLWNRIPGQGKGHPQILVPDGYKKDPAAEMASQESQLGPSLETGPISADRMDTGQRNSDYKEAVSNAGIQGAPFSPLSPNGIDKSVHPVGTCLRYSMGLGFEETGTVEAVTEWSAFPGQACYRIKGRTIPHSRVLGIEREA